MKRLRILTPLFTLILGVLLLGVSFGDTYASTATSGAFRIDKPQVFIQSGLNSSKTIHIGQRGSAQDTLEFQNTGVLVQHATGSGLKATVGMQLIEIGENTMEIPKIPVYASSNAAHEYIHVRKDSDIHRAITFSVIQKLDQIGTSDSINIGVPQDLSKKNSFLGTLAIFIGAY